MTLNEFARKYGTRGPFLIVHRALDSAASLTTPRSIGTLLDELLADWESVLETAREGE